MLCNKMDTLRMFKSLAIVLLLSYQCLASSPSTSKQHSTNSTNPNELVSSASAPHSITRLHQIWTSTSSDRLDELSPELISKMKANVPFLEAYALRPRLVGASESFMQPQATTSYLAKQEQDSSPGLGLGSGSSNRRANYFSSPGFSGFSELKVESASLSKTEHHHKRTASLKKRADDSEIEVTISRDNKGKQVNGRGGGIQKRKRALSGRVKFSKSTRHRALFQEGDSESKAIIKEPKTDEVKGGSSLAPTDGKRKPFYGNALPDEAEEVDEDESESGEEAEPRRVGDGDVEEEGDTVMVEPKSDGVADDPDLPDYEDPMEKDGRRVNRGQPEGSPGEDGSEVDNGSSAASGDQAGGGGLGASSDSGDSNESVTPGVERAESDFLDDGTGVKEGAKSLNGDSHNKHDSPKPDNTEPENDLEYRDDEEQDYGDSDAPVGNNNRHHKDNDGQGQREKKNHPRQHDQEDEDHQHKNSLECLEDAVPGQPGLDYPILSRVNSTSFRCSDHKYPGYYADTEAGCQVFHYCRPDGTQDSFLCPNGTIFSQKTSVCVWWNTFQCEDAPKYIGLNALLYKQHSSSPQEDQTTNTHPIDGPIHAMKRPQNEYQPQDDKTKTSPNFDIDDEAVDKPLSHSDGKTSKPKHQARGFEEAGVQRKSDVPDEADADLADAQARRRRARLLSSRSNTRQAITNNNNVNNFTAAPRRTRRASTRQAPPKLKSSSRRYMRPSKRVAYRIKNVSKPRRRF